LPISLHGAIGRCILTQNGEEKSSIQEARSMKAYVVITARAGTAREIADAMTALPGVQMADACWGGGDVYAVVEFPAWPELNSLVLDKVHSMPGVIRTETHVAVER
jgi:hypothetical protein